MKMRGLAEAGTDNSNASYGSDFGDGSTSATDATFGADWSIGNLFGGSGSGAGIDWTKLLGAGIGAYTTVATTNAKLDAQTQAQQLAYQQAQLRQMYPYGYTYSSTGQIIPSTGSTPLLGAGLSGTGSLTTIIGLAGLALAVFTLMKDK